VSVAEPLGDRGDPQVEGVAVAEIDERRLDGFAQAGTVRREALAAVGSWPCPFMCGSFDVARLPGPAIGVSGSLPAAPRPTPATAA
jgi:hypothetical protein